MRRCSLVVVLCGVLLASCGGDSHPTSQQAAQPAALAYPPEVDQAAQKLFGPEAQVLAYGDLAKNGKQEALVVSLLKIKPENMPPGTVITRAVVIEKTSDGWNEEFLCDEHMKNPKGYLGGQPLASVPAWRLQYEQDPQKGLTMYFTPVQKPEGGYIQTFGVQWNPEEKRYQMLDRNFDKFLMEVPTLEPLNDMPQK